MATTKTDQTPEEGAAVEQAASQTPAVMGATFAERKAARLGLPVPDPVDPTPTTSTFAERKAAREKAVQDGENKAVKRSATK